MDSYSEGQWFEYYKEWQTFCVMVDTRQSGFSFLSQLTHVRKQPVACEVKRLVQVHPGTLVGGLTAVI